MCVNYFSKCDHNCLQCLQCLIDMLASPAGVNWVSDQCRLSLTKDRRPYALRPVHAKSGYNLCVLEMSHMGYGSWFDTESLQPQAEMKHSEKSLQDIPRLLSPSKNGSESKQHVFLQHIGIQDLTWPQDGVHTYHTLRLHHFNAADLKSWTKRASHCKVGLVVENPVVISSTSAMEHGTMKP